MLCLLFHLFRFLFPDSAETGHCVCDPEELAKKQNESPNEWYWS